MTNPVVAAIAGVPSFFWGTMVALSLVGFVVRAVRS